MPVTGVIKDAKRQKDISSSFSPLDINQEYHDILLGKGCSKQVSAFFPHERLILNQRTDVLLRRQQLIDKLTSTKATLASNAS